MSKKALGIIDMQQRRAYGLGYLQAIDDMKSWLTSGIPLISVSVLERLGTEAAKSLDSMNDYHRKDVDKAANELLEETHEMLGVEV